MSPVELPPVSVVLIFFSVKLFGPGGLLLLVGALVFLIGVPNRAWNELSPNMSSSLTLSLGRGFLIELLELL